MAEIRDIETTEDIKAFVNAFYQKALKDKLIGPIFNNIVKDNWPHHLEKMYSFWQTVLFQGRNYSGSPFPPHARLPVEKVHFDRWLKLFHKAIDARFTGKKAEEAKWKAEKMAEMFYNKILFYRQNPSGMIM